MVIKGEPYNGDVDFYLALDVTMTGHCSFARPINQHINYIHTSGSLITIASTFFEFCVSQSSLKLKSYDNTRIKQKECQKNIKFFY